MPLVVKDRVLETTTTTGTGTYTLAGALTGYQTFSVIGDANTTYYTVTNGTDWEVGIGTYTLSGTTLSRDTILESSNAGSAVNWGAETKTVFCVYPAERAVMTDVAQTISNKTITENVSVISTNTNAVASTIYVFTATLTLTLPASPAAGDWVGFVNRSTTTTPVIGRNGTNIMGLAEDLTVDNVNGVGTLVYSDATRGWVFTG